MNKWNVYYLLLHGRLAIAKSILMAQYIYIGTIMDILGEEDMQKIQNSLNQFVDHNKVNGNPKSSWIPDEILYAAFMDGGFSINII